MSTTTKTITEIVNSDLLDYSMYVLQNRAIPSAIDGFKSGGRKLVYTMCNDYPTRKVKVAELAGSIAKYGFHHGESSAEGAVVTLTGDWNNNCPVFTGHGNFGSRLIQESAAARYIYVSLSPNFKKYFIDHEITIKSCDSDSPEPQHYLPIIPWVLVPGISGIAVGFACNILPRSVPDIIVAVKSYLKNPDKFMKTNALIAPTFPHFTGTISSESVDGLAWKTHGIIEYIGKYTYKITELPIGYDREAYVTLLNDMIDSDKIKDYEDNCSEAGFGFTIKTNAALKEKIDQDPLKYFKLTKSHTENLTTLGIDGKLKIFGSVNELIKYFCDYRLTKFSDKIEFQKQNLTQDITVMQHKVKWIDLVARGKVNFKKLDKTGLLQSVVELVTAEEHGKRFINIPLYECTQESITALEIKIRQAMDELDLLKKTTPMTRYLEVLK